MSPRVTLVARLLASPLPLLAAVYVTVAFAVQSEPIPWLGYLMLYLVLSGASGWTALLVETAYEQYEAEREARQEVY